MANSYTQLYIHYITTVNGRENLLKEKYEERIRKYITGIVQNRDCKMLAINNVTDHIHFFIGLHPSYSVSKIIQEVKSLSSKFINENNWYNKKFAWQGGYGAFSYSKSQINNVVQYIANQKEHHKKITFREEYLTFLKKFEIPFDEKYLFTFYD